MCEANTDLCVLINTFLHKHLLFLLTAADRGFSQQLQANLAPEERVSLPESLLSRTPSGRHTG